MNKEILQKRLKQIEEAINKEDQAIAQAMANINMLNGGKQECLFWLKQLGDEGLSLDELKTAIGADSVELVEK